MCVLLNQKWRLDSKGLSHTQDHQCHGLCGSGENLLWHLRIFSNSYLQLRHLRSDIASARTMEEDEFKLMVEYFHRAGYFMCLHWLPKGPESFELDTPVDGDPLLFFMKPNCLISISNVLGNLHRVSAIQVWSMHDINIMMNERSLDWTTSYIQT